MEPPVIEDGGSEMVDLMAEQRGPSRVVTIEYKDNPELRSLEPVALAAVREVWPSFGGGVKLRESSGGEIHWRLTGSVEGPSEVRRSLLLRVDRAIASTLKQYTK